MIAVRGQLFYLHRHTWFYCALQIHNLIHHTFTEGFIGLDRDIIRVVSYQYLKTLKFQINTYKIALKSLFGTYGFNNYNYFTTMNHN